MNVVSAGATVIVSTSAGAIVAAPLLLEAAPAVAADIGEPVIAAAPLLLEAAPAVAADIGEPAWLVHVVCGLAC
jgi:hypothetical protein